MSSINKNFIELQYRLNALGVFVRIGENIDLGKRGLNFTVSIDDFYKIYFFGINEHFKDSLQIRELAKKIYLELHSDIANYRLSL